MAVTGRLYLLAAAIMLAGASAGAGELPGPGREHADLACVACHPGGPEAKAGTTCSNGDCHAAVAAVILSSPHDREHLSGAKLACSACHRGHPVVGGRAAALAACGSKLDGLCYRCHAAERYAVRAGAGPAVRPLRPGAGVHRCATSGISCFGCHGAHTVLARSDPSSPIARSNVAETCGGCHEHELEAYRQSSHAAGLAAGDLISPTCVSCHGAHAIGRPGETESQIGAARVVRTCEGCHEDPQVLNASNLGLAVVDSYERSIHGIAYNHEIYDVATCASCHGAHRVLPPSDPRSPVHPDNVRATCAKCHTAVTEAMVEQTRHPGGSPGPLGLLDRLKLYFPVAGTAVNPLVVSGMGGLVGFLSGIFGVGGGFLMTPLLIFIGIPAAVAAATDAAQITAGASSGAISHARLGNVDFRMGLAMVAGSWPGGFIGVQIVHVMRAMGNFDFFLKLLYVVLLGFTGITMFIEGVRTLRGRSPSSEPGPGKMNRLFARLPFEMSFPKSRLRISVLVPVLAGFIVGILAAFLGVGGGFILMPMMIYIIGIPTIVAVGTGLFQIVLTCAWVTIQQSITNHTVDVLLAVALFAGSVLGAQFGVLASRRLRGEQIRVLLAVIVLLVMAALLFQLVGAPDQLIQFARSGGGH